MDFSPQDYGKRKYSWKWDHVGAWAGKVDLYLDEISLLGALSFCCICSRRVLADYLNYQDADDCVRQALELSENRACGKRISAAESQKYVDSLHELCRSPIDHKWKSALLDVFVTVEAVLLIEGSFYDEARSRMGAVADRADVCPKEQQYQLETIRLIKEISPFRSKPPFGEPVSPFEIANTLRQAGWHDDPWIDGTSVMPP